MSCRIDFLPIFWMDYENAIRYISLNLKSPTAAHELDAEFERIVEIVRDFPRISHPYPMKDETGAEYRCISVGNYLAFYIIRPLAFRCSDDEAAAENEVVEFRRFLYGGSDYASRL